jgi:hypothetical protein
VHAEKLEMKECHEQIGLAVMGAVRRGTVLLLLLLLHIGLWMVALLLPWARGKEEDPSFLSPPDAISDTFLPFRIALVSLILFLGVAAFLFCRGSVPFLSLAPAALLEKMDRIRVYEYEVVHEFPHDPTAFTQV